MTKGEKGKKTEGKKRKQNRIGKREIKVGGREKRREQREKKKRL